MSHRKGAGAVPRAQLDLERYEAKYLIHPGLVPSVREFIAPFCVADAHTATGTAEYIVTTLQLDSEDMVLYRAKQDEAIHRFKLRVRTYGLDGYSPVFLEIKRKIKGVIAKSRVAIPYSAWGSDICLNPAVSVPYVSTRQVHAYLEFVRLVRELGARPKILIRYHRESYLGTNDQYARVTLDRRLCYRPTRAWELLPGNGHWWRMDSARAMGTPFSGVILEMKTFGDVPVWMVDMTERFNLERVGFSKYYNAVRMESAFAGDPSFLSGELCGGL